MNSSDLNDLPSVRLASGVEMQQRWPSSVQTDQHQQQQQKNVEAPRLIEMSPVRGSQGTIVTVVVQSLSHRQFVPVKLAFNSLVVDTKQMQAQGITSLVAAVPPFQQTHSATANVPISVCMLDKDSVTETWPVAEFVYDFDATANNKDSTTSTATPTITSSSTTTASSATEPIEYAATMEKRNVIDTYQPRENFLGGSSGSYDNYYQQPVNNYNQQMPQYSYPYNNNSNGFNDNKLDSYSPNNDGPAQQQSMNSMNYNNTAASALNLFNPNNDNFSGMLSGFGQTDSTPTLPATTLSQQAYASNNQQQQQANPAAAYKQQQQQHQRQNNNSSAYGYGKSSIHVPSTSVANYQPYPGLVSRANLKIVGDLDSMAKNWAAEEWEQRRRLVQFWREPNGNEIRCTFNPVAQGERITTNSGHIVVSCIYWAERNDCFITSVDCIHLLESLMDIRFSVEEKNRVRRNLEGFRPLTVSKCKADSADFFKLIMSFPNPKPRNIEKDVKVFPWKTLPYALKKIVTKYTASSYNTTGGAQQQQQQRRAPQLTKSVSTPIATPAATPPPINTTFMNASPPHQQQEQPNNNMNQFYQTSSNIYQQQQPQQFNAYQNQNSMPISNNNNNSSMYSSPSIPQYNSSSAYTQQPPPQQQVPSPAMSPTVLQYPCPGTYHPATAPNSAPTTPEKISSSSPTAFLDNRRTSLDNQQVAAAPADFLVNFKPE